MSYLDKLTQMGDALRDVSGGIKDAHVSMGSFMSTTRDMSTPLSTAAQHLNGIQEGFAKSAGAITGLLGHIDGIGPAFDLVGQGIGALSGTISEISNTVASSAEALGTVLDVPKEYLEYDKKMTAMAQRFGGTAEEAKAFGDQLRAIPASGFGRAMLLDGKQLEGFTSALAGTNLTLDQQSESMSTVLGTAPLLAVAYTQFTDMNISAGRGASLLNQMISKQGMTATDAVEQLAGISRISKDIGMSAEGVAQSLNNMADSFEKLGVTAAFGAPLLAAFGKTAQEAGFGVEVAQQVTQSLSKALLDLTGNYAQAYLTMQSGALEIPGATGGGVLGSGIALQAAMRPDSGIDQGELAMQMAGGMRDVLEQFGGGDIITVEQANQDQSLQAQFFTQQQMLKGQYGISDTGTQNQVLDLLSQLEEAQASGNTDRAAEVAEQLTRATENKDATVSNLEKVQQHAYAQVQLLIAQNRILIETPRRMGEHVVGQTEGAINATGAKFSAMLDDIEGGIVENMDESERARMQQTISGARGGSGGSRIGSGEGERYLQTTAARGTRDLAGTRQAAEAVNQNLSRARRMSSEELGDEITRAAMEAAASASKATLQEGGFASREEFARVIADAIAEAVAGQTVTIGFAGEAEHMLTEIRSNLAVTNQD